MVRNKVENSAVSYLLPSTLDVLFLALCSQIDNPYPRDILFVHYCSFCTGTKAMGNSLRLQPTEVCIRPRRPRPMEFAVISLTVQFENQTILDHETMFSFESC